MGTGIAIGKEVLSPYLERDPAFKRAPAGFWDVFLKGLAGYELDPKPLFAAIYRLELKDPERILERLPHIYQEVLERLAEQYVLNELEGVEGLPWLKLKAFHEKVAFYQDLKSVLTRLGRKEFIRELPAAYAALSEEISEGVLARMIAEQERAALREKFAKWDRELEREEHERLNFNFKSINYSSYIPKRREKEVQLAYEEEASFLPPEETTKGTGIGWYLLLLVLVILGLAAYFLLR